jgi:hypothetical protein
MNLPTFSEPLNSVILDLVPLIRQLFVGQYAIAVAGSHGKRKSDGLSDIDLRAYFNDWISDEDQCNQLKLEINGNHVTFALMVTGHGEYSILTRD